jgi:hypothetical protein
MRSSRVFLALSFMAAAAVARSVAAPAQSPGTAPVSYTHQTQPTTP